jgi:ubiquinone/menaquinone biosynthesis C-methylase UbiE
VLYYIGRWSREIACRFVSWLGESEALDWLDIGCGTGALSQTILEHCAPKSVLGIDPSDGFLAQARDMISDGRAKFEVGSAEALPCHDESIDVVTSALTYNFIPDRVGALKEMARVARSGGAVSFYVWDYPGGGIGFVTAFWKAAVTLDSEAKNLAESTRFPFCTRDTLRSEMLSAGFIDVIVEPIQVATRFADFEAFWYPFTLGAGPAPGYCVNLSEEARSSLKRKLVDTLGTGAIELPARAWAVRSVAI